jgi:thiol-disulfide isomerase/thioredoxin
MGKDFTRPAIAGIALLIALGGNCSFGLAADGESTERSSPAKVTYKFEPGQLLVYRLTSQDEAGDDDTHELKPAPAPNEKEWRIFVDKKNDDGSWRLYVRTKLVFRNDDKTVRGRFDSLDYLNFRPDGTYDLNEKTAVFKKLFPNQLFCRLPRANDESERRWKSIDPLTGNVHVFELRDRDGDHLRIAEQEQAIYSEVNRWQSTLIFDFDSKRGLPRSIVDEFKEFGQKGPRSKTTIELVTDERPDANWCEQFWREVQPYLDLYAESVKVDYLAYRAHSTQDCRDARTRARALLLEGQQNSKLDLFADLWKEHLQAHDNDEKWMLGNAAKREQFFAATEKDPADWTVKRLDGADFKLAEHRGQVTVLYFWSDGCEYCVLTAPQIRKLADDYSAAADVCVAGAFVRLGLDDEDGKAKIYADRVYRGFPNLEGKELTELYHFADHGITGYPTTIVLDQSGKVRELFGGYSSDLGERIRTTVEGLRAKK